MSKRFTETTKWADPWFRDLTPRLKAFWIYLLDNCDCAGVWVCDYGLASFCIGENVSQADIAQHFKERVSPIHSGKVLVLKFIRYQYGVLSPDCNMHRPVFASLEKNSLNYDNFKGFDTIPEGFLTLMVKDQVKEKDQDQVKEELTRVGEKPKAPKPDWKSHPWFANQDFTREWDSWGRERKAKGTERSFAVLKGLAGDDMALAIRIVAKSADNGWKGLFELDKGNGRVQAKGQSREKQKGREYDEHLTL